MEETAPQISVSPWLSRRWLCVLQYVAREVILRCKERTVDLGAMMTARKDSAKPARDEEKDEFGRASAMAGRIRAPRF